MPQLNLYNRKTGDLAEVLSEEATDIVSDALSRLLELPANDAMNAVVAIFHGYVILQRPRK